MFVNGDKSSFSPLKVLSYWQKFEHFSLLFFFFFKIVHRLWSSKPVRIPKIKGSGILWYQNVKFYILIKCKNIKNKYQFCTNVSCVKYVLNEYWPVQLPISEKKILYSWLFTKDFSEHMQPTPSFGSVDHRLRNDLRSTKLSQN